MNAKELRSAAIHTADDLVTDRRLNGDKVMHMAQYILSTVRDDDDDLVTYEWLCSTKTPYMESRKIWWNFDGYTVSLSSSGARFHCNHMPIASVQSRGQFRALCKGLGIVLEETT